MGRSEGPEYQCRQFRADEYCLLSGSGSKGGRQSHAILDTKVDVEDEACCCVAPALHASNRGGPCIPPRFTYARTTFRKYCRSAVILSSRQQRLLGGFTLANFWYRVFLQLGIVLYTSATDHKMSAIGSLVFCTDCGNLLPATKGTQKNVLECECCGAENKG